jgi:hypothetical protein
MPSTANRFSKGNPCPVCTGHTDLPQGKGVRCAGYLSEDGRYAFCTREQFAGPLQPRDTTPESFAHLMEGSCRCGTTHGSQVLALTPVPTKKAIDHRPILPVPPDAPAPSFQLPDGRMPERIWDYRDANDNLLGYKARYAKEGGKDVLPYTYCETSEGSLKWLRKDWVSDKPLRGLRELAQRPSASVLVVEGEKTQDAAKVLFPDFVVVTWPGGCGGVLYANWSSLAGRLVTIWPDADEAGAKAATKVAEVALTVGSTSARIVRLPQNLPDGWDLADLNTTNPENNVMNIETAKALLSNATPYTKEAPAPSSDWMMPVNFEGPKLPQVPPTLLPPVAREFAAALTEATETPSGLPVGITLASLALAVARRYVVAPEPNNPTYRETTNLWVLAALPPGNRKSAVLTHATAPLLDWEHEAERSISAEMAQAKVNREVAEGRAKDLQQKAIKATSAEDREKLQVEAQAELASLPEVPAIPRLWTGDVTPERLGTLMAENDGRMGLLSDEGGIFDTLGGRYSGGVSNLDTVLQSHSGSAVRIDRNGRPSVYLKSARLTQALTPQPEVLRGLASKPDFRGRGLLGRFLYIIPTSNVGFRTLESKPLPQPTLDAYHALVHAILDTPPADPSLGTDGDHILQLSPEAWAEWKKFARTIESTMRPGGALEHATDWGGKLPGTVARIAAVFHVVKYAQGQPWEHLIEHKTMMEAVFLGTSLIPHTLVAFDLMGADPDLDNARRVWAWVEGNRFTTFTGRQAFEALKGRFKRMEPLRSAFELLVEHHYIRLAAPPERRGRGQPAEVYEVNPHLMEGW